MIDHGLAEAEHSLLLVIDIQTRLAQAIPEKPRQQMFKHVGMLGTAAQLLNLPVLCSEQYPSGLGPTEPSVLAQLPELNCMEKTCFSCMQSEDFVTHLHRYARQQIILCGMESHVCVLQTALQLQQRGYRVFVVQDAIAARHKHQHLNAVSRMQQSGIIMSNVESVMFEWLRDSQHPNFKAISQLLR